MRVGLCGLMFISLTLSCGTEVSDSITSRRHAVIGGTPAEPGDWLGVAWLETGCSAVLVHPEVVVFAEHCGVPQERIWFGDQRPTDEQLTQQADGPPPWVRGRPYAAGVEYCRSGRQALGMDIAYCVLDDPLVESAVPFARPIVGCEALAVVEGIPVTIAGWGGVELTSGEGTKRVAVTTLTDIGSPFLSIGDEVAGTCPGDSGGPAFVSIGADEAPAQRLLGILLQGPVDKCGLGLYVATWSFVDWLELTSQIDITPCFTGSGQWDENADCPADDVARQSSCGAPAPRLDVDRAPPELAVALPGGQGVFLLAPNQYFARVKLDITAEDTGHGVRVVEARIPESAPEGTSAARDWFEPYWLELSLPVGTHSINVTATDRAGNNTSETVNVQVVRTGAGPTPQCDVVRVVARDHSTSWQFLSATLLLALAKRRQRKWLTN